jgi:hypothetical protein
MADLKSRAVVLGLSVHDQGADGFSGEKKSIQAKWLLGSRSVTYRMSCRLAEAEHTVHYREAIIESSWGLPPPTLSVQSSSIKGWKLSGSRTDRSVGGGGTINYGEARDAVKQMAGTAGWEFLFEGGRLP